MDSEHQDVAAGEFDQARAFLLAQTAPVISEPSDALYLLAELDTEADDLYARAELGTPAALDDLAGYRRRRAYVWVQLAQLNPQFEEKARSELGAWQRSEAAVITAVTAARN